MTENEREQVLKMIEDGKISPEDGLKLMHVLETDAPEDETPPNTAEADPKPTPEPSGMETDPRIANIKGIARRLWMIPLWIGIGIMILSAVGMSALIQADKMNFWFYCLIAPLLLGLSVITLAATSHAAHWIFVDVEQKPGDRPRRIFLGFPFPMKIAAWFLRTFGNKIDDLKDKNVDQIAQAIETGFSGDEPLIVNVDEGEDGNRVKVYIG